MARNLPPLKDVDPDIEKYGQEYTTELNFPKCKHELYPVSSTEARCKKCPVGYTGHNILALINASKT